MTSDTLPGSRDKRATKAIYLAYVEGLTQQEIADRLDITQASVSRYLSDEGSTVPEEFKTDAVYIHAATLETLRNQLQKAIRRAENAETVIEEWGEEVTHATKTDDDGQTVERIPIPDGFTIGPDHDAQADARKEVREILEKLRTVTGANGTTIEISSDEQTGVDITTSVYSDGEQEEE